MSAAKLPYRDRSPRKARICTECNWRNFGELDWNCPRHGPRKTVDQEDNRYFGRRMLLVEPEEEKPDGD